MNKSHKQPSTLKRRYNALRNHVEKQQRKVRHMNPDDRMKWYKQNGRKYNLLARLLFPERFTWSYRHL